MVPPPPLFPFFFSPGEGDFCEVFNFLLLLPGVLPSLPPSGSWGRWTVCPCLVFVFDWPPGELWGGLLMGDLSVLALVFLV